MNREAFILKVVQDFYDEAKVDVWIGYHFRHIQDFDAHIPRIASFWELQVLGSSSRPLEKPFDLLKIHGPLGIKRGELGRWLILFRKSLATNVNAHPEFSELAGVWEEKIGFFEKIFLRFFGF